MSALPTDSKSLLAHCSQSIIRGSVIRLNGIDIQTQITKHELPDSFASAIQSRTDKSDGLSARDLPAPTNEKNAAIGREIK